jgi:hypothetical protein
MASMAGLASRASGLMYRTRIVIGKPFGVAFR